MNLNINVFAAFVLITTVSVFAEEGSSGLIRNEQGAFEGYTLFTPLSSTTTYLIDMEGHTIHTWQSNYRPGQSEYLLEDGYLLRAVNPGDMRGNGTFHGGGVGGGVQKLDWDGNVVWDFSYSNEQHCSHHDIEPMPNGNILIITWEKKTKEEAISAGRDPDTIGDQLWPDCIIEVKPKGSSGGDIVWQWHVWDHLIQDLDPRRENYGSVEEHPERVDLNYGSKAKPMPEAQFQKLQSLGYVSGPRRRDRRPGGESDWNHTNSIDYNAKLDQIVLSVHSFSELWIIDHSTTTEEAAGHTGGKYGKGGDLLYRWGNPQTYKMGTSDDQQLFVQHDVQWIEEGLPGAGDLLVFNNGQGRADGNYSSVDQISPPINKDGGYDRRKDKPFGPKKAAWTYTAENKADFYSSHISGTQRLANGNTLICSGEKARFFEVTPKGQIVWEYRNANSSDDNMPEFGMNRPGDRGRNQRDMNDPQRMGGPFGMGGPGGPGGPRGRGRRGGRDAGIFRVTRLPKDYPGLANKDFTVASKAAM